MTAVRGTLVAGLGSLSVALAAWASAPPLQADPFVRGGGTSLVIALLGVSLVIEGFADAVRSHRSRSRPSALQGRPVPPGTLFVGLVVAFAGWIAVPFLLLLLTWIATLGVLSTVPVVGFAIVIVLALVVHAVGAAALGLVLSVRAAAGLFLRERSAWSLSVVLAACLALAGGCLVALDQGRYPLAPVGTMWLVTGASSVLFLVVFRGRFPVGRTPGTPGRLAGGLRG